MIELGVRSFTSTTRAVSIESTCDKGKQSLTFKLSFMQLLQWRLCVVMVITV